MADVKRYGHPHCATCKGRGVTFDIDHRPHRCVPCSSERREEQTKRYGYVLECRSCSVVLTVEECEAGRAQPKPTSWRVFGPLCGECMSSVERERKSA